jgi:multidrug resistance efflux pump
MKSNHFLLMLLLSNSAMAMDIYPQVSANILEIKSAGEQVKSGDLIVKLDARQANLKLERLQVIQQTKQQDFDDAQLELNQTKELYDRMVASHRDVNIAQLAFDEKKRALDAHILTVQIQAIELEKYIITSPISGTIKATPNLRNSTNHFSPKPLLIIE